jgi:cytochrome c oxidase cbb3-type subunit 3
MSDFTDNFWSWYVAALTLVSIVGALVLLWATARKKMPERSDNTTGHVWDEDLRESNNPMPRWWMWLFVLTVIYSLLYLIAYPGLGTYPGEMGWSTRGEYDARGSKGFPNLADTDWLHGGSTEKIKETLTTGRKGQMPPMAAAVGTPDDVKNVAHYVLSLSGGPHDSVRAQLGKFKFGACAACHGIDGKGSTAIGAPNLADDIWLHGWGEQAIVDIVNKGKTNSRRRRSMC